MQLVKRILGFVKPYRKMIFASILASMIYAMFNSLTIWMSATFINTLFTSQSPQPVVTAPAQDEITANVTDKHFSINDYMKEGTRSLVEGASKIDTLHRVCVIVFIAFVLKNLFGYIKGILISRVNYRTVNHIRNTLYAHLQKLSLGYYHKTKAGEITSIVINDVSQLTASLSGSIEKLIMTPIEILILVSILLIINWKLTLLVLILSPVMATVLVMVGQSIRRKSLRTFKQAAVFVAILQETVMALRIVKAFAMEKTEIRKFKDATDKFYRLALHQRSLQLLGSPINEVLATTAAVLLLWIGGSQVISGSGLSPEDFIRFIIVLFSTFQPIKELTTVNNFIQPGFAAAERLFGILDIEPQIQDHTDAVDVTDFRNFIEYKSVWFRYEDHADVLKDINLKIARGEVVAFVGQSGAGKSTLVDLVPRFYDATKGSITIDGVDIRHITNTSLKGLFGIVSQETILFNDTVRNNIAYGAGIVDDAAIEKAAHVANAHDFILNLENGYNTEVGDRGIKLSGGQCQRIAIARAILRNPPILILDEATSSLDTESERLVQDAIDHLMENRTVLVIAHRLSTVIHADKIVVLHRGRIVDTGSHRQLLKKCPIYRHLYEIQFQDGGESG